MPIDTNSFEAHEQTYKSLSFQEHKKDMFARIKKFDVDSTNHPTIDILRNNLGQIRQVVDIGCGCGWATSIANKYVDKVYSIEPSNIAIEYAKKIFPNCDNVQWIAGHAEDVMPNLILEGPTLFFAHCVLSHLNDTTVVDICKQIDLKSSPGSKISFVENFDANFKQTGWYSRKKQWWQSQFPFWEFDFSTYVRHKTNCKSCFVATKK